jgi:hypothetical protein
LGADPDTKVCTGVGIGVLRTITSTATESWRKKRYLTVSYLKTIIVRKSGYFGVRSSIKFVENLQGIFKGLFSYQN